MKKISLFIILVGLSSTSFAQTCAQTLRLARATYEQGRLHEIAKQLEGCLKSPEEGGFSKEEKQLRVDAYKILCLSYIYLEEPQKADEAMLNLKRTDPYYRPNPEVDPAEFVALYNSFRKEPVYRIGVRLGVNFSQPNVQELVNVVELAEDSEFKRGIGFQFGAGLDVPIMLFKQKNRWTLHGELLYQQRSYEIDIKEDRSTDPNNPKLNEFEGIEKQTALSFPVSLEYKFIEKKFNPYIALGFSTDLLLSSTVTAERKRIDEPGVPERGFDPEREPINLSALAAAGVKLPVGPGFIVFEVRYAHGLTNISSPETAYANQSLALDYGYADSVFKLSSLSLAGSYIFNKHNPKKITHKK